MHELKQRHGGTALEAPPAEPSISRPPLRRAFRQYVFAKQIRRRTASEAARDHEMRLIERKLATQDVDVGGSVRFNFAPSRYSAAPHSLDLDEPERIQELVRSPRLVGV